MKKQQVKKVKEEKVDIKNDKLMIELGMRLPDRIIPDFSKTLKEKKMIKKMKKACNEVSRNWSSAEESSYPLESKIIVNLKKNISYPKTTYSRVIWQYQIDNYINSFRSKKGNCLVKSYYWNGKTYNVNELPINPYEYGKKLYKY